MNDNITGDGRRRRGAVCKRKRSLYSVGRSVRLRPGCARARLPLLIVPFPFPITLPMSIRSPFQTPFHLPTPFTFQIPFRTPTTLQTLDPIGHVSLHHETPSFSSGHLVWHCQIDGPSVVEPVTITALLDNGSPSVLIDEELVAKLGLRRRRLPSPRRARMAMGEEEVVLTEWVKLKLRSEDHQWTARVVRAIVAPKLAYPVILGGPFLKWNKIVIDHELGRVTAKEDMYQLLPVLPDVLAAPTTLDVPVVEPLDMAPRVGHADVLLELRGRTRDRKGRLDRDSTTETSYAHLAKALGDRLYILAVWDDFGRHEQEIREEFKDRFPDDIPHVTRLPDDVYHRFRLKDPEKVIKCRSYACPKKYRDAWKQLLDQHLAAGRIRESSSEYCSPSFLIPKADPTVLPRWVNDFRALNDNTIPDHYPLPCIETILSDCAKGSIWAKIDMTNSFFQTRVHPDDIKLTAVMTPFGLYEWVVMPMGCRNAPATHQRRMNQALRKYIGVICHVYLDDIVIWSSSIEEHRRNVRTVLQALREAHLYCSTKKSQLFATEIDFLGHHISQQLQPSYCISYVSKQSEGINTFSNGPMFIFVLPGGFPGLSLSPSPRT